MTAIRPDQVGTAQDVHCTHCTLPVPAGLIIDGTARQFCCSACRTAYAIIHEHGLDDYYAFAERRDRPVTASGRAYEEFDHEAFRTIYVREGADGLSECDLYLDGVHCASCVWLVEKVPLAIPGVISAELDIGHARCRVRWDRSRTPLSAIARFLDALGYVAHPFRGARAEELRRREDRAALVNIGIAGAIAGNVMMIALAIYAGWFGGIDAEFERYFRWWSFLLTTPTMIWPGRVFFKSAWGALRQRALHMDVPIAVAIGAGYLRGAVNTFTDTGPVYFDGVATLIFLLLVGRFLQQRAQRAAADSAELLFSLAPNTARVVGDDGVVREVPTEAVLPGAVLDVRAGDTFAADGVIVEGRTAIDLSLLTGESRPVSAAEGAQVFGGTVNVSAPIRVAVTRSGESSRIGQLLKDVEESARRRAPVVKMADRMAGAFIAVVLVGAAATYWMWMQRDPSQALDNAIAMLVVTCPCALALATPMAITVAIGRAARRGILIKGGDALERLATPGRLLLDKTGTLTTGRLELETWDGDRSWRPLVAALEQHSRHPVAAAVLRAEPGELARTEAVRETIGGGIRGRVAGRELMIGKPSWVMQHAIGVRESFAPLEAALTPVLVAVDGIVVARMGFGDPLRPEAAEAVRALRARGWQIGILSGDDPRVVASVGRTLGIAAQDCRGGASPEDKRAAVEQALLEGPVVMVGDGVNDAAAIASASVGIGVRGGAEACLAASDVFLAKGGIGTLIELETGARRSVTLIRLAIGFSLFYNIVGAAMAFTGIMDPLIAAIVMPTSSLSVVIAAWRGRTFPESVA
jgi:Cu2+-exporting ATPase